MTSRTPPDSPSKAATAAELAALDHAHLWHPFTPMKQWRESEPLIISHGQGEFLYDTQGRPYIDGVSSLWCNVHGHRVPAIDQAIREQLDRIAHTTLLGLSSPPAILLAARLAQLASRGLNKVFYSDAGATALEVAFKMAVGYWHHLGRGSKHRFIGLSGAYHGDTTGSMSVGYSDLFHRAFTSMVFPVSWFASVDAPRASQAVMDASGFRHGQGIWPSEHEGLSKLLMDASLQELEQMLASQADHTAAVVIEPVMQGAAGMVCQPAGFVREVARLTRKYEVLLIADEVATGFGRTGKMLAIDAELPLDGTLGPNLLCLAKGITGGYLPLAATLATDAIEQAFTGELAERKTLFHGHTYTGNPLASAAALASIALMDQAFFQHVQTSQAILRDRLGVLHENPCVLDVRQRGLMVGIELCSRRPRRTEPAESFDFSRRTGAKLCMRMRDKGVILRPLGDVLVLMPVPAMAHDSLHRLLDVVLEELASLAG